MSLVPLLLLAQLGPTTPSLSREEPVQLYDESARLGHVSRINCSGAGITCTRSGNTGTVTVAGGSGAPTDATYWVGAAHASLSAEINLGALGTGLVINTTGTPSIKGSNTCTNQFPRSDNASGTWTCASVADADLASSYSGVGTCTNQFARVLNDNAAPTCASVVSADMNITTTSCTNQFVTAISAGGVGTCTTDTLAGAQHANQGTTTTVLHGNAAGNPSWAAVTLNTDTTGVLNVTNGGTGAAPGAGDQLLVSDSTAAATWRSVPDCTDTGGNHLNYTAASNTFSCGTSGGGSGYNLIEEDGTPLTARTTIDFTGAGVTCSDVAGETRCNVPGGSGNIGSFTVTFGTDAISRYESDEATVSAAWVGASSDIVLVPKCHVVVGNNTVENCFVSRLQCAVVSVSAGVSFNVRCHAEATASGSYTITYTGA
jgi:hypothetical protein